MASASVPSASNTRAALERPTLLRTGSALRDTTRNAYPGPSASALLLIPPAVASGLGRTRQTRITDQSSVWSGSASSRRDHRYAACRNRTRSLRCRRILRHLPGLHSSLPSRSHRRTKANGARRRAMVRELRQVHSLLRRGRFVWYLHRRVSLDAPGCTAKAAYNDGATAGS